MDRELTVTRIIERGALVRIQRVTQDALLGRVSRAHIETIHNIVDEAIAFCESNTARERERRMRRMED